MHSFFFFSFSFFSALQHVVVRLYSAAAFRLERKDEKIKHTSVSMGVACAVEYDYFVGGLEVGTVNLFGVAAAVFSESFLVRVDAFEYSILLRPTYSYSHSNIYNDSD